ncbi:transglutaminase-like enzyme, predicted cysteine protease [Burkholderiales bacterium JOSHI_001]|nr:transglutaminase-like enzyme, predicted cysteine protease [Burkholderiales bacterium JOSHI_001]
MIRIELDVQLNYLVDAQGADFVFHIHAAQTPQQHLAHERLLLSQPVTPQVHTDSSTGTRAMTLRALPGPLNLSYQVTVDLLHHATDPAALGEVPLHQLPPQVMPYIYPSRYCPSDRLLRLAAQLFGHLPHGHSRVQAIQDWVGQQVCFTPNSSTSTTWALDTLVDRVGVCRDFSHLMIALCRALNIPARFATGTDYGADPVLGPPDFHAYVEVYLGHRWYIFDPSGTAIPMGFVRFATGHDAADTAFATIFGGVAAQAPVIRSMALYAPQQGIVSPQHSPLALSTDDGTDRAPVWH